MKKLSPMPFAQPTELEVNVKKLMLAACIFTMVGSLAYAQEGDNLKKIGEDYQKAGQNDDRIDAEEMNGFNVRLLKLLEAKKGKRTGFEVCLWIYYVNNVGEGENADKAKARGPAHAALMQYYNRSDRLASIIEYMVARSEDDFDEFSKYLGEYGEKVKHKGVKAQSYFHHAEMLRQADDQGMLSKKQAEQMMALYKKVATEFADVEHPLDGKKKEKRTFGKLVKATFADLKAGENAKKMKVGTVAPEITSKDLDGVKFNLSDYRGKIVMLDFYGHW